MNVRPILAFLSTLLVAAPITAIGGIAAGGTWAAAGTLVSGLLVAWTARLALVPIRTVTRVGGIQLRMRAVVWTVATIAWLLAAGSAIWLGWILIRS